MRSAMKMFRRVLVLRRIAAADVSADEAKSEMHPAVTHLDAFLALVFASALEFDLAQVCAILTQSFQEADLLSSSFSFLGELTPASDRSKPARSQCARLAPAS